MWGRWGLRNNLTKTLTSSKPAEIGRLFQDERVEVIGIKEFPLPEDELPVKKIVQFSKNAIILGRRH